MTERDIRALLDHLVEPFEGEGGDWEDVLERAVEAKLAAPLWPRRLLTLRGRGRRVLLFAAAGALTAVVLLAATAPWRGGPSVLDRAAAAIASPGPGQILFESITIHGTPMIPPERLRALLPHWPPGVPRPPYRLVAHVNVWMAGASPYRFRLTEAGSQSGRLGGRLVTMHLPPTEIGSTLGAVQGLGYDAAAQDLYPLAFDSPVGRLQLDVAGLIRQAIRSGRARVDGTAVVVGRSVVRIRVFADVYGRLQTVALYFVDAKTFRPVRVEITAVEPLFYQAIPGFPLLYLTSIQRSSLPGMLGIYVLDFDTYRDLTPTPANQRQTSIQAAHPRAKIV
jgi:hypothetical protein